MAKYDITKEATEDLFRIWEYTVDTWSEEQADTYYGILESAMNEVGSAPATIGKPYDEIIPGLRAYHVRRHMVFYVVQENGRALIAWRMSGFPSITSFTADQLRKAELTSM